MIEQVKELYTRGYAVREVANELGISIDRVYKLMRRKKIPRRNPKDANEAAFLRRPASFKPVFIENQGQEVLKALGVALYWAEGAKTGAGVDFANSDPRMVKLFLQFLREVCGVRESKLTIYLYCYPQHDVNVLKKYWADITNIPTIRFTKPYVRKDAGGKVGQKLNYGLVHVRYYDKKLLMKLCQWAGEYCTNFVEERYSSGQRGRAVNAMSSDYEGSNPSLSTRE